MSPTGDLIVTLAQVPSPVAQKLHFFGCSSPSWGNARKRYFHSAAMIVNHANHGESCRYLAEVGNRSKAHCL